MTEREREIIKLKAAYRNGLAIVFFGAGCFTLGMSLINRPNPDWITFSAVILTAMAFSFIMHFQALRVLKMLPGPIDTSENGTNKG